MIIVLLLLVVLAAAAALARLVGADGRGWRPPPAVDPMEERMSTWPR